MQIDLTEVKNENVKPRQPSSKTIGDNDVAR